MTLVYLSNDLLSPTTNNENIVIVNASSHNFNWHIIQGKSQEYILTIMVPDLPPVKPSAIALGTVFNHGISLAVLGPVFGETYRRAQAANSKEEFIKSKEAASAATAWATSLVGSAIQSYGVAALINATGTLSYKGAAYLGSLIFMASSAPSVSFFTLYGHVTQAKFKRSSLLKS
jgi:hypothetical protein